MFKLRDYQEELLKKTHESMQRGNKTIVVESPPRTGKTILMAEIARKATAKGNRVLFVVHRKEVVEQAIKTFEQQQVNMNLAQLGMVQTITRHVDEIPVPQVIFVDEGHHALAQTYTRILDHFPNAFKLLFTATPHRTGRKQLDLIADDIVTGKSIKWLTEHGNLAPFKYYSIGYIDTKKLKKNSTGDYTAHSMDQAIDHKIYGNIVNHYQKLAHGKQAVVYCYSVENALAIAKQFNQHGISAVEVDAKTPNEKREAIVEDFRQGKIKILTNVNLFTEGIDLPNVDCVIMVRPTASLSLYLQFSMRCLNPRKGKEAIIIDHVANWKTFGLPNAERDWKSEMQTSKKRKSASNGVEPCIQCPVCFQTFKKSEIDKGHCPVCGAEIIEYHPNLKKVDAELEEIQQKMQTQKRLSMVHRMIANNTVQAVADKSIGQLKTYQEFVAYAQLHGYRKQWAYVMYNKIIRKRRV